ncbi:MAG: FCD domain-containing protein [Myxococcota bacterium]
MKALEQLGDVSREPLAVAIARRMRLLIYSGELEEGQKLPSEKELGEILGVGRSSVREAVRILQAQGLVSGGESISTKGPVVSRRGVVPCAATALESALRLSVLPLGDMLELRLVIEQAALSAAARVRDCSALSAAQAQIDIMAQKDIDVDTFHRADIAFHAALIDASHNRAFSLLMTVLRDAMATHLQNALKASASVKRVIAGLNEEHREIYAAVRRGHGSKVGALIRGHLEDFYRPFLESSET